MIFFWFLTLFLFTLSAGAIIVYLARCMFNKESAKALADGFKHALADCGLFTRKNECPIELYKWVTMDDEDVCDDCLDRASWPPMDIADWMKYGLPQTSEADTECCRNEILFDDYDEDEEAYPVSGCRCRLVLYRRVYPKREKKNKNPL